MEFCNENFTNAIFNVTQQRQALGGWVYLGYIGGFTSFILLVLYLANVCVNIMKNPPWTRRYQAWITSLPLAISFLSLSSYFVPRSAVMCEAIKFTYMPFILMLFIEVTFIIGGGEESLLECLVNPNVKFYPFNLPCKQGVSLNCYECAVDKNNLRIANALVYQTFISSLLLTIIMVILEYAEVLERDHNNWAFWILTILNMATFALGSWSLSVLVTTINSHLEPKWPKFMWKYNLLIYFIGLQKLQNFSIGILTFKNVISAVTGKTIDAGLSMCEAFIFGILLFAVFKVGVEVPDENNPHTDDGSPAAEPEVIPLTSMNESATDN